MQSEYQDDVLSAFQAMDLMWLSVFLYDGADADEAYDALFGPDDWVSRLAALHNRVPEFEQRFEGQVVGIDDFAAASGHEAVAKFAGRVAAYAPVRKGWIPTRRQELRDAKATGDRHKVFRAQRELSAAVRDFAAFMLRPFRGWQEHRAWMRRSVEQEARGRRTGKRGDPEETCSVTRIGPSLVEVVEGKHSVKVRGPRRSWLLLQVVAAGKHITWQQLVEADMHSAAEVLDRRVTSRAAAGSSTPRNATGSNPRGMASPRMATQSSSLQNLGSRLRRDLGKLAYHWNQDGDGVVWNSDCH